MKKIALAVAFAFALAPALAPAQTTAVANPQTFNVTLTTQNTEYSFVVPANTRRLEVSPRGGAVKLAWVSGTSGTTFKTVPVGANYCQGNVALSSGNKVNTIYLQSTTAGAVAEITVWR